MVTGEDYLPPTDAGAGVQQGSSSKMSVQEMERKASPCLNMNPTGNGLTHYRDTREAPREGSGRLLQSGSCKV